MQSDIDVFTEEIQERIKHALIVNSLADTVILVDTLFVEFVMNRSFVKFLVSHIPEDAKADLVVRFNEDPAYGCEVMPPAEDFENFLNLLAVGEDQLQKIIEDFGICDPEENNRYTHSGGG